MRPEWNFSGCFINLNSSFKDFSNDLPSCPVFDYYLHKVKNHRTKQMQSSSSISPQSTGIFSLFVSKNETPAQESSYFNSQIEKCNNNNKALCYLVRGLASTSCLLHLSAMTDYNMAISLFLRNPDCHQQFGVAVAYYNRALTFLELKQYDKACDDFESLKALFPEIFKKSSYFFSYIVVNNSRMLALLGKYLAQDNFASASEIFIESAAVNNGWFFETALNMLLDKSLIGTGSLLFKNFATVRNARMTFLKFILDSHLVSKPGESHLNIEGIRSFYKAMMTRLNSTDDTSKSFILYPADLEGLDQPTIDAIFKGLTDMEIIFSCSIHTKPSRIEISSKLSVTPVNKNRAKAFTITEIKGSDASFFFPSNFVITEEDKSAIQMRR